MQDKFIGNFKINPVGIGTWMMGGGVWRDIKLTYADYRNNKEEVDAIKYSISKGQNHLDGAQLYGAGHTDELIGDAIQDFDRSKLFVASKIWKIYAFKDSVVPATKEILRKMKTSYLDLLYVHAPFPEVPMNEYISGLNDAFDAGLVRNIGVSNFSVQQLKEAMELSKNPILANQIRYNVLYKTDANQEMLDFCERNNIMVVAYRPVERKLLADETANEVVLNIAKKYGKTPSQIALNWLINQDNVITIPKSVNKKHIDENLESLNFTLDKEDIQKLDSIESIE